MQSRLEEEWSTLPASWKDRLTTVLNEPWFRELGIFLDAELARERGGGPRIFPPEGLWLRALREVPFESVRAVILGQDPYHGAGQAIGASFAVPNSLRPWPPSLVNIFKEVASDLQKPLDPACSDLSGWMAQGVLLLNTVLTVREGEPLSHRDHGWEKLTDAILRALNDRARPMVFLLWGAPAQKKRSILSNAAHRVLEAPHPSPLSSYRGFFGCRHFSRTNAFLAGHGLPVIDWTKISA